MKSKRILIFVLMFIFLILLTDSVSAMNILYVGKNETYKTLQAAVDAAQEDDEIRIKEGTYEGAIIDKGIDIWGWTGSKEIKPQITTPLIIKSGNIYMTNLEMGNNSGIEILPDKNIEDVRISSCDFKGMNYGIKAEQIKESEKEEKAIREVKDIIIQGCNFEECLKSAIYLESVTDWCYINGNDFIKENYNTEIPAIDINTCGVTLESLQIVKNSFENYSPAIKVAQRGGTNDNITNKEDNNLLSVKGQIKKVYIAEYNEFKSFGPKGAIVLGREDVDTGMPEEVKITGNIISPMIWSSIVTYCTGTEKNGNNIIVDANFNYGEVDVQTEGIKIDNKYIIQKLENSDEDFIAINPYWQTDKKYFDFNNLYFNVKPEDLGISSESCPIWISENEYYNKYSFMDDELNLSINTSIQKPDNIKNIDKISSGKNMFLSFEHTGKLKSKLTIVSPIWFEYNETDKVTVYHYNEETNKLEKISEDLEILGNGYVTFEIDHCSEYILSTINIKEDDNKVEDSTKDEEKEEIKVEDSTKDEVKEEPKVEDTTKEDVKEETKKEDKKDKTPKTGDPIYIVFGILALTISIRIIYAIRNKKSKK